MIARSACTSYPGSRDPCYAFLQANATEMGKTLHKARRRCLNYGSFIDIRKAYPTAHHPAILSIINIIAPVAECLNVAFVFLFPVKGG